MLAVDVGQMERVGTAILLVLAVAILCVFGCLLDSRGHGSPPLVTSTPEPPELPVVSLKVGAPPVGYDPYPATWVWLSPHSPDAARRRAIHTWKPSARDMPTVALEPLP